MPRADLWVRRSITDVGGAPVSPSRRGLADILVAPAAVPPGPGREALFDLVTVYRADTVRAGADNAVYVRSANLGTASVVDPAEPRFRHRLFQLDVTASPITRTAIGGDVLEPIPAGGFAIVEFTWNPGAAAAGDRLFVLAAADHDSDGRRLEVPETFETPERGLPRAQRRRVGARRSARVAARTAKAATRKSTSSTLPLPPSRSTCSSCSIQSMRPPPETFRVAYETGLSR